MAKKKKGKGKGKKVPLGTFLGHGGAGPVGGSALHAAAPAPAACAPAEATLEGLRFPMDPDELSVVRRLCLPLRPGEHSLPGRAQGSTSTLAAPAPGNQLIIPQLVLLPSPFEDGEFAMLKADERTAGEFAISSLFGDSEQRAASKTGTAMLCAAFKDAALRQGPDAFSRKSLTEWRALKADIVDWGRKHNVGWRSIRSSADPRDNLRAEFPSGWHVSDGVPPKMDRKIQAELGDFLSASMAKLGLA